MTARDQFDQIASILEGIPVWGVLADTPAARAGVRTGDVILYVNGRRARTVEDYLAAKDLDDGQLHLVVFRDGADVQLECALESRVAPRPASRIQLQ